MRQLLFILLVCYSFSCKGQMVIDGSVSYNPESITTNTGITISGNPTIVGYGDSNTKHYSSEPSITVEGWEPYSDGYMNVLMGGYPFFYGSTIVNSGTPGMTSTTAITNFTTKVRAYSPKIVVMGFGTNDLGVVSYNTYITNMGILIDSILSIQAQPVLLNIPWRENANASTLAQFNAGLDSIVIANNLSELLDVYTVTNSTPIYNLMETGLPGNEKRHWTYFISNYISHKFKETWTVYTSLDTADYITTFNSGNILTTFNSIYDTTGVSEYFKSYHIGHYVSVNGDSIKNDFETFLVPKDSTIGISFLGKLCIGFYTLSASTTVVVSGTINRSWLMNTATTCNQRQSIMSDKVEIIFLTPNKDIRIRTISKE